MSGLRARVCVFVCTRRARQARTFTSDETAVELPRRSPGAVAGPAPTSARMTDPSPGTATAPLPSPPPCPPRPSPPPPPAPARQPGARGTGCGWDRVAPGKVLSSAIALVWGVPPNLSTVTRVKEA